MIRLIKNELFKIFHKKGIYIIFIISLVLSAFINILMNIDMPNTLDDTIYNNFKQVVEEYDRDNITKDEYYVQAKMSITDYELRHQKKEYNGYYNPEYYYITSVIGPLYNTYYSNLYINNDTESAEMNKKLIDEALENLKNFNWRKQIEVELKEKESEKEMCSDEDNCLFTNSIEIEVLKYRLDNNIPYSFRDSSSVLDKYVSDYNTYKDMEKDESKIRSHEDLLEKRQYESDIAHTKYLIDHKLIKDNFQSMSAASVFVSDMCSISMLVVICIVLVSSAVVADEFNKGTIKQLLIRPYSRTKIIISKFIATFITILTFIVLVSIGETIVTGLVNGSFNTLFEPVLIYNYNTHSLMEFNIITAGLLKFACVLPEVLIITLLTFFASTLFTNNGISTAIGIITYFAAGLLKSFIDLHVAISYFPLVNWDFNDYLFGSIPACKYLSLTKAIIITVITIVTLFVLTLVVYKRKDIKNQ